MWIDERRRRRAGGWEGEAPAEPPREGEAPAEPRHEREDMPQRKRPASGVFLSRYQTTIVYVTVCTRHRRRWLATPEVHELLCSVWREATAWLVGRYVIMPDHIHLFAALGDIATGKVAVGGAPEGTDDRRDDGRGSAGASPSHGGSGGPSPSEGGSAGASPSRGGAAGAAPGGVVCPEIELDAWVTYWKSRFSRAYGRGPGLWQPRQWDTRLRRGESYLSKWDYVRHNPVRHALVARAEDWPFQGEIFALAWRG